MSVEDEDDDEVADEDPDEDAVDEAEAVDKRLAAEDEEELEELEDCRAPLLTSLFAPDRWLPESLAVVSASILSSWMSEEEVR